MQAYCRACNYHFEAPSAREDSRVKCVACGRRAEITEGPVAGKKSRAKLNKGEASCSMCGKTLAAGVRYCVACGTTNNDMGGEAMAVDSQLHKSARRRLYEEDSWWHMLLRMFRGET